MEFTYNTKQSKTIERDSLRWLIDQFIKDWWLFLSIEIWNIIISISQDYMYEWEYEIEFSWDRINTEWYSYMNFDWDIKELIEDDLTEEEYKEFINELEYIFPKWF